MHTLRRRPGLLPWWLNEITKNAQQGSSKYWTWLGEDRGRERRTPPPPVITVLFRCPRVRCWTSTCKQKMSEWLKGSFERPVAILVLYVVLLVRCNKQLVVTLEKTTTLNVPQTQTARKMTETVFLTMWVIRMETHPLWFLCRCVRCCGRWVLLMLGSATLSLQAAGKME